jgi:hypothetical protein
VVRESHILKRGTVACSKAKLARIQYVVSLDVPSDYSENDFLKYFTHCRQGGLLVSGSEGILDSCLVLVGLSLLLPSRTLENATAVNNGGTDGLGELTAFEEDA